MRRWRWAPPLCWAALIFIATSVPNPNLPSPGRLDLLVHVGMYGALGLLAARAVAAPRVATLALVAAACSAFGALDEWHQRFVPGRFASVDDWGADTVGAVLGIAAYVLAARQRREPVT